MAASTSSTSSESVSLTSVCEPYQPRSHPFPKRSFGKKNIVHHSFQAKWFDIHTWLHYDEVNDTAFCYLCMNALKSNRIAEKCADSAFISRGFSNWSFRKHEVTNCHKEAVDTMLITCKDCGDMLSSEHVKQKAINQQMLLKILSSIR